MTKAATAKVAIAERLGAMLNGVTFPAATDAAAWHKAILEMPQLDAEIKAANANKYKNIYRINNPSQMLSLSKHGAELANAGIGKSGKLTAEVAIAIATRDLCALLKVDSVCRAAIVSYACASPVIRKAFAATRAETGGKGVSYMARDGVAVPAWLDGYVAGRIRNGVLVAK